MAERELKATLAEKRDGVGIITLNRPEKLNAINQDIMDDLYYLFDAYEEDPEVRVIVLTGGDGKAFCAGGDIEGEIQMDVVGCVPWRHRGQPPEHPHREVPHSRHRRYQRLLPGRAASRWRSRATFASLPSAHASA